MMLRAILFYAIVHVDRVTRRTEDPEDAPMNTTLLLTGRRAKRSRGRHVVPAISGKGD